MKWKALKNKILGKSVVDNVANPASAYNMRKRKVESMGPAKGFTKFDREHGIK